VRLGFGQLRLDLVRCGLVTGVYDWPGEVRSLRFTIGQMRSGQ
jgi:hypothetical protein